MFTSLVADALIKTTLLLALVAIAAYLLRRRSAALRHLLWMLGIAGLIAIPAVIVATPFRLRILPRVTLPQPSAPTLENHGPSPVRSAPAPISQPRVSFVSEEQPANTESGRASIDVMQVLLLAWLVGALILIARYLVGYAIVRRISRRAHPITDAAWVRLVDDAGRFFDVGAPDLRRSEEVAMPFACGLVKPVIVLPSSCDEWSIDRREAVLMHELAHISRGDLAMNTLSHFVRALYWFHPLAWLAAYRLRVEGERACDDAVLRAGALPSDYAEHLLSIVRTVGNTVPTVALAMARRSDFEGRLLAILEAGVPRAGLTRMRAAGMAAVFLVAVMPLAAMAPANAPEAHALQQPAPTAAALPASEQSSGGAVTALIETLSDANPAVRVAAVTSLGRLGDPRAIAALAKAMREDPDPRVREAAAYALGGIDDSRAVAPLLEALKSEKASSVREKIVHSLGEIKDPIAVSGISAVVKDPSAAVRREAVWALGELEDPAGIPALLTMVKDEDADVRQHTAEALGQLKVTSALDALAQLTHDDNADVRSHAVNALGQIEDMRALPTLLAALKDANADVRSEAADAIHSLDGVKTAPRALIDALADPNRDVRKSVANSLGSIGDAAAVPALKRLTADNDTEVRHAAAEALSEIGGPEAIQALMGLLKDQDPEIRRIAAEALGSKRR